MTGSSFCRPKLIIVAKLKGCFSFCLSSAQCQHFDSRKRGTGDSVHVTIHSRNVDNNSLDLFIPFCPNPIYGPFLVPQVLLRRLECADGVSGG